MAGLGFLDNLPTLMGPLVSTLFGLIALDLLLGVAVAIKSGEFQFWAIANFYKTNVVPYIIGWVAFVAAGQFLAAEVLPADLQFLAGNGIAVASFSAIALSIGSDILTSIKALYAGNPDFPETDLMWPEDFDGSN
jgi:hypothetical protein